MNKKIIDIICNKCDTYYRRYENSDTTCSRCIVSGDIALDYPSVFSPLQVGI
jgi:hypothetical protein